MSVAVIVLFTLETTIDGTRSSACTQHQHAKQERSAGKNAPTPGWIEITRKLIGVWRAERDSRTGQQNEIAEPALFEYSMVINSMRPQHT